jgi:hypothetical protein
MSLDMCLLAVSVETVGSGGSETLAVGLSDQLGKSGAMVPAKKAAFFCTRSNAFICPPLHGSQHTDPYSRTGHTDDMWAKLFFLFLFVRTRITK